MKALEGEDIRYAVLPDHPVPIKLRKHTRTPVPVAICGTGIETDSLEQYSETLAPKGNLGFLKGDEFMRKVVWMKKNTEYRISEHGISNT
jgi:2,3-bisphosphoglycerate-independent phosphoglycerate mutase